MAPRGSRNLVNLEQVQKSYGTRMLLDGVSLGVGEGERVGVVGRNGDGKTTLLRVLTGGEEPDGGRVSHAGGLHLGLLSQVDDLDPAATVGEVVVGDAEVHEWAGDAAVRDVMTGLFGSLDTLDRVVGQLSGGERRRVALARLLVADPDLLVLDEPTNHLDVEGIAWLAAHLASPSRRGKALVVVTHDRWFLDEVATTTWEVAGGQVYAYDGGYSAYVLARAERERVAAFDEARRTNLLRKELAWLRRGPPARTSKPQFRIDAANALIAAEPEPRDSVALMRFASARLGRTVFELDGVTLTTPGEHPRVLLDGLDWILGPGDRLGLVGVNGSGKTTVLRLLAGAHAPAAGRLVTGSTVRLAYLSQEVRELDPALRVLESVEQVSRSVDLGGGRSMTASQLCERFGFTGDKQWTPVGELSGGERRRLQLLRLLMDEPNVLLLDEPTNDLDIETLTALEDLLDGWPGTLVVVSHDRYFVERTTDTVVALMGDGRLTGLVGGVEEYLVRRAQAERATLGISRVPDVVAVAAPAGNGAPAGPKTTDARPAATASAAEVRVARKDLQRVERALERLTTQEGALHGEMAAHSTDYERVAALHAQLRDIAAEKAVLEEQWLEAAERAE